MYGFILQSLCICAQTVDKKLGESTFFDYYTDYSLDIFPTSDVADSPNKKILMLYKQPTVYGLDNEYSGEKPVAINLIQSMIDAALSSKITCFKDENLTDTLNHAEIEAQLNREDTIMTIDPNTYEMRIRISGNVNNRDLLKYFRVHQRLIYNYCGDIMYNKVLAIAPLRDVIGFHNIVSNRIPLFWIKEYNNPNGEMLNANYIIKTITAKNVIKTYNNQSDSTGLLFKDFFIYAAKKMAIHPESKARYEKIFNEKSPIDSIQFAQKWYFDTEKGHFKQDFIGLNALTVKRVNDSTKTIISTSLTQTFIDMTINATIVFDENCIRDDVYETLYDLIQDEFKFDWNKFDWNFEIKKEWDKHEGALDEYIKIFERLYQIKIPKKDAEQCAQTPETMVKYLLKVLEK